MSLSLISQPNDLTLARNPVVFGFRATNSSTGLPFAAQGVHSILTASSVGRFNSGQTLTIAWTNPDGFSTSVVFTAVATPTTETQIPDSTYSGTGLEYWQAVADRINAHHVVGAFFKASRTTFVSGFLLKIYARSTAAGWSITTTNSAGFSVVNTNTVTADTTPANYRVRLDVFVESKYKLGDWSEPIELSALPDSDGYLHFDLSSILDAFCRASQAEKPIPDFDQATPFLADNLRRYWVRYAESFGNPEVIDSWTDDFVRRVMNGGVSQALFAGGDYFAGKSATDAFLSWMPSGRSLDEDTPEFLPFYNAGSSAVAIKLEVKWYRRDTLALGATNLFFTASPLTVGAWETALIPVKPSLFGLTEAAQPNAYKMEVRVLVAGSSTLYLSEARTYFFDRQHYESRRYLMFLNSFGLPETLRCTGLFSKVLEIERQTAERILRPNYSTSAKDSQQFFERGSVELTYRTGFVTAIEADVLFELLVYRELWDVSPVGYLPIRLTAKSFEISETNRALHSYSLKAALRLDMRNYSRKIVAEVGTDLQAWLDENGVAWLDPLFQAWQIP